MKTLLSIKCEMCKKTFEKRKGQHKHSRFCSRSCNAKFTIAGKNKKNKINLLCIRCGKEYAVIPSRIMKSKYCSISCRNKSNAEKNDISRDKNHRWKGGIQTYRKDGWNYYEKKCCECQSETNIELHHVNSNRSDNRIENLKPICRRCHQKLDGRINSRDNFGRFIPRDV